jgi:hypothetical protein
MLKAILSYSKKIPVVGQQYSSHSYHLSLETEMSEGLGHDAIQRKLHDTFELVKTAVEHELEGSKQSAVKPVEARTAEAPRSTEPVVGKASNKQIKYITDLAREQNIPLAELNSQVLKLFGVDSVYALTKGDASKMLDSLRTDHRKAA